MKLGKEARSKESDLSGFIENRLEGQSSSNKELILIKSMCFWAMIPDVLFILRLLQMGSSITTSGITFQAISEFQDQLGRIKKRPKD